MIIKEIQSKAILSKSKFFPYVINPYVGCQHNCTYCYAIFMKRFTGHREPWGQFVDVKVNAVNYHHADWVYRKYGLEDKNTEGYFEMVEQTLWLAFKRLEIAIKN